VTYWKYGFSWSDQSNQHPSSACATRDPEGHFGGSAAAYARPLQAGGRADVSVGSVPLWNGLVNGQANGASAGAFGKNLIILSQNRVVKFFLSS